MSALMLFRFAPRLFACGLTLAALGLSTLSAHAQNPLSYTFVDLNLPVSYSTASITGFTNGYAVGTVSAGSFRSDRATVWNLETGATSFLDHSGLVGNADVYGGGSGYAVGRGNVGNSSEQVVFEPMAWNLQTGTRTMLDSSGLIGALPVAVTGNYAVGSGSNSKMVIQAWDLTTGRRIVMDQSIASRAYGAGEGYAAGVTMNGTTTNAAVWDLSTGSRRILDSTGFTNTVARGITNGFAVGTGLIGASFNPLAWNLQTGAITKLYADGISNSYVIGGGNGYALGYGAGVDTGLVNNAIAWNAQTGARTNLQSTFMPSNVTTSNVSGVGDDGSVAGTYTDGSVTHQYALVSFKAWQGDTLAAGRTAKVNGNVTQTSGITTINGNYAFVGGAGNDRYTLTSGVLQGTGSISGNLVNTGGILAVGNLPGSLTINGNFTQGAGGIMDMFYLDPATYNPLLVTGNTTLGGTLNLAFDPNFTGVLPDSIDLINTNGLLTGSFDQVNLQGGLPAGISGYSLSTVSNGGTGSIVRVNVVRAVPESGTLLLMGLPMFGLALAGTLRRRA